MVLQLREDLGVSGDLFHRDLLEPAFQERRQGHGCGACRRADREVAPLTRPRIVHATRGRLDLDGSLVSTRQRDGRDRADLERRHHERDADSISNASLSKTPIP